MRADLDLLCISVYCTADDLLPSRPGNGRRKLSDAEIVTLCVAQVLMGIPSDRRFLRAAKRQLAHLFPLLPSQDAFHKRRARLAESLEWLTGVFAANSPGSQDDLLLLDSTPVECGRSVVTARRSQLAEIAGYGYSKSHSRWFWGMRLHLLWPPTAPHERPAWSPPTAPNEKQRSNCSHARSAAAKRSSATKATPAPSSPAKSPSSAPPSSAQHAEPNPTTPSTSPRSGNESSRSSSPAKTSSPSNATAHAPCTTSAHGSRNDYSH